MTADVNFGLLRRIIAGVEGARPHGPVGQGQFLREMGIGARLTALAEQPEVTEEQVRSSKYLDFGSLFSCCIFFFLWWRCVPVVLLSLARKHQMFSRRSTAMVPHNLFGNRTS